MVLVIMEVVGGFLDRMEFFHRRFAVLQIWYSLVWCRPSRGVGMGLPALCCGHGHQCNCGPSLLVGKRGR